jgi:hypothetical protein
MATAKERLDRLEKFLNQLGYNVDAIDGESLPAERADFIEFGSERHAMFLGVTRLADESEILPGDVCITSNVTGHVYRLDDPITPFMHFANPEQAAIMTLRGKIGVLESGGPIVHESAPTMWVPKDVPM